MAVFTAGGTAQTLREPLLQEPSPSFSPPDTQLGITGTVDRQFPTFMECLRGELREEANQHLDNYVDITWPLRMGRWRGYILRFQPEEEAEEEEVEEEVEGEEIEEVEAVGEAEEEDEEEEAEEEEVRSVKRDVYDCYFDDDVTSSPKKKVCM